MKETVALNEKRVLGRSRVATFGLLFLFSTFCAIPIAFAQSSSSDAENDNVVVEVAGMGETAEEARVDCWRQALSRVCETYVESKRVVINDELFEKIVSYTEGKIVKTEEISQSREDGAIILMAKVTVSQKQLYQELAASFAVSETGVEISQTPPDGANRDSALNLLKESLSNYPACVLKASVRSKRASNLYVPTGETRPLTIADVVTTSDGESYLDFDLVLSVDDAKYRAFAKKIVPLLEKVAEKETTDYEKAFVLKGEPTPNADGQYTYDASKFILQDAKSVVVAVCVNSNATGSQTRWRKFVLAPETVKSLELAPSLFWQAKLEFLDGNGDVVVEKLVNLEGVVGHYNGGLSSRKVINTTIQWKAYEQLPGIEFSTRIDYNFDTAQHLNQHSQAFFSNFALRTTNLGKQFTMSKQCAAPVRESIFDDEVEQIESLRVTFVPLSVNTSSENARTALAPLLK